MIIKSIEFIRFSKCIPIANTMGIGMVLLIKNDHISMERDQHFGMLQTAQIVAAVEKEKKIWWLEGQTATKMYYQQVLHWLRDAVWCTRPNVWKVKNWQLHHNSVPAHSSHLIHISLTKHGIPVIHQLPYSLDLAPGDFRLIPKFKTPMKGFCFERRDNAKLTQ